MQIVKIIAFFLPLIFYIKQEEICTGRLFLDGDKATIFIGYENRLDRETGISHIKRVQVECYIGSKLIDQCERSNGEVVKFRYRIFLFNNYMEEIYEDTGR